ncbi:MAG: HAD hydrolase-like protein, partial [Endomicrobiia bacterium]
MKSIKYKAIMFDLDGTLLNTIDDIADCSNKVLKKYNFLTHKTHKYKLFVGDGIDTLVYRILPKENRNKKFIKKIVDEIKFEYSKNWSRKTMVYPEIFDLLKFCQMRK